MDLLFEETPRMTSLFRRALPIVLAASAATAHAQYLKTHGGSLSVGATGQFSTILTSNASSVPFTYSIPNGSESTTVANQQQYTTDSVGLITSLQLHPVPWAGIALNYGYTRYSERFAYTYANTARTQTTPITTGLHEFTGGYELHPKHIPFQPFLIIGGGALDFNPTNASNQWRGAGYLETGFDLPVHNQHFGFRISGRELVYRAPNFYQPAISTRAWRSTEEPSISTYYRF
jgi:alkaline phosphatase